METTTTPTAFQQLPNRRGRPRKPVDEKAVHHTITAQRAEVERWRTLAKARGMTLSAFIRAQVAKAR